jgi:hypothetical protein
MSSAGDWLADVVPTRPPNRGRPAQTPGEPKSRLRKLECPGCGFIARASAGALARSGAPSCGCGDRMEIATLRDRVAVGDPDALAELERCELASAGAQLERAAKREQRENGTGYATRATPCSVCGRFKSRPADVCGHCGDAPARYGATPAETRAMAREHNRGAGYDR